MSGFESVIFDVFAYSFIEECGLLTDHTKASSQMMYIVILNVDTINDDLSFINIVKPLKQLMNC